MSFNAMVDCQKDSFVYVIVAAMPDPPMTFFGEVINNVMTQSKEILNARWYSDLLDAQHALWHAKLYYGRYARLAKFYFKKEVLCLL